MRVLVIDQDGNNRGEMLTDEAIALAREMGSDLIEVAPLARPPVCRIGDFGKLKYEKKKKDAVARKTQTTVELKEIKLRPKTDDHDLAVKLKHARRFLGEGDKVKVTCRFRGREIAHREIGEEQCLWLAKECDDLALIESPPKMEMKQMFMILAPRKAKVGLTDGPPAPAPPSAPAPRPPASSSPGPSSAGPSSAGPSSAGGPQGPPTVRRPGPPAGYAGDPGPAQAPRAPTENNDD